MAKVAYQDESGLKFIIENPDNKMRELIAVKIRTSWENEFNEFMEEVRVTLRTMENGTKIIKSKPLEIKIVKDETPVPTNIEDLEPLPKKVAKA